jgi:Fe-S-cluster containining protein
VNLVDLAGAALHLEEPVSVLYRRQYAWALLANGRHDWLRMAALKVRKPCPFLENDLCGIYPVRPLPCALFPENLVYEGSFAARAGEEHFREYLCLRRPLPLSPARTQAIAQMRRMWERENLVSCFYLYGNGSCYVDFSNLLEELPPEAEPSTPRVIPNPTLERFFVERMAGYPPFSAVEEKISRLDSPEGLAKFLQLCQDDRLFKKLRENQDDRALVFRLVKGKLRGKRRSLLPREYQFYG